jgi:large subunit ribosomal protein L24
MERKLNTQTKLHIKTGDSVKVIAGDDKGKTGKVLSVDKAKSRAIVEGLNMITKHVKPTAAKPQGGIEKKEAGMHISNLMLVDPKTGETTRTGRKANDKGKLVRYSKKTGEVING